MTETTAGELVGHSVVVEASAVIGISMVGEISTERIKLHSSHSH